MAVFRACRDNHGVKEGHVGRKTENPLHSPHQRGEINNWFSDSWNEISSWGKKRETEHIVNHFFVFRKEVMS